jgi:NAD(P)-dependent dehydrogenase (short-subunit alcohol dehydrogenase family)
MATSIVTGSSQGLGLALTRALSERGWHVVVDARHGDALREAVGSLPNVTALAGDGADPDHRRALVAAAVEHGGVDLLVNNAGALGPSPLPRLAEYPLDALRDVVEANLVAPVALIQEALPHLVAAHGTIVNVTSDAAVEGYPGWGGYGSSKAAFEQASRVLAAEQPEVRVLWVDPGDMRTQMHQDAFPGDDISDRDLPEASVPGLLALIEGSEPSGRYQAKAVVPA